MMRFFTTLRSIERIMLIAIMFVNSLFIFKYGARQHYISPILIVGIYTVFTCVLLFAIDHYKEEIDSHARFNFLLWIVCFCLFFIIIFGINFIDGESLNVLRWKGMNTTIESILNGEYPYTKPLDYRGDTTSNFPGLFYLGLPFYLLGDVGYLQVFSFFLVTYFILSKNTTNYRKSLTLLLLFVSIPFWWEILAKSDLMSNLFLLVLFILWWKRKYQKDYFKNTVALSFFVAFFLLTRLIMMVPIALFLFFPFIQTRIANKIKLVSFGLAFTFLLLIPFLIVLPDFNTLVHFNPIENQTSEAPLFITITILVSALLLSKRSVTTKNIFSNSFLLILILVFSMFVFNLFEEGLTANIYGKTIFDISYFGMIVPFIVFYFLEEKNTMHA